MFDGRWAGRSYLVVLAAFYFLVGCSCEDSADQPVARVSSPNDLKTVPALEVGPAHYVGAATCVGCHAQQQAAWHGSHHDRAMELPSAESVQGDFSGARFKHSGEAFEFVQINDGYAVRVSRVGQPTRTLRVAYTFGVHPLQQVLVDVGSGRLQALTVAWDCRPKSEGGQRWFHLHGQTQVPPGDPLHWESPQYTWNSMCVDCHSTGVERQYDEAKDSYTTSFSEINVSCESCHGPASQHLVWARSQPEKTPRRAPPAAGFAQSLKRTKAQRWVFSPGFPIAHLEGKQANETKGEGAELLACAPCHSRRGTVGMGTGPTFHDDFRLSLLNAELYFPDGQIKDEVFEYGSFLQSKMHAQGVVCSDCHEPHSLRLRAEGNALCGRCHQLSHFDAPEHHFHALGSEGARCVSCHMPETTYMGVDRRRDHSFQIPEPGASALVGAPDACTRCHSTKSQRWAQSEIERHHPASSGTASSNVAVALWRAREGQIGAEEALWSAARDQKLPAIERASVVEELAGFPSPELESLARELVRSENVYMRRAVVSLAFTVAPQAGIEILLTLLHDEVRSVRFEAMDALLAVPQAALPKAQRPRYEKVLAEYTASRLSISDQADAQLDLSEIAEALGKSEEAAERLLALIRREPTLSTAYLNLADLYRRQGKDEQSVNILLDGVSRAADPAMLHHSLGLCFIRIGQRERGLGELELAYKAGPERPRLGYVYAVALFDGGKHERAIKILQDLVARRPGDAELVQALVTYLNQVGRADEAEAYTR